MTRQQRHPSPCPLPKRRDSTTHLSRIEPRNLVAPDVRRGFCPATSSPRWLRLLARGSGVGDCFSMPRCDSHSNVAVRLRYFLSPAAGERIKVRGRERFMGRLHSFLARIGTLNLPHVRFVVERFRADFRVWRNSATTALKRSTKIGRAS